VLGFLRFIGTVNAAIWLGASIAFTGFAIPAVFSREMHGLFQPGLESVYGRIAMVLFARFFLLQYACATIAVLHAAAGLLYLGRPLRALGNYALLVAVLLTLAGGLWFQPAIRSLHAQKYSTHATAAQRAQAGDALKLRHGLSEVLNLIALAGLAVYFWRTTNPNDPLRLTGISHKFRG
jgi:hypothetical protein